MKKIISILIVIITSLQMMNFAAAVSDNEGSAFISKPEYDSLRSDFQNRINEYNTSIDNKIEDAIVKYLEAVVVNKEPMETWSNIMYATNNKFRFASFTVDPGSKKTDMRNNTMVNVTRVFNHPECEIFSAYLSLASGTAGVKYQIAPTKALAESNTTNVTARQSASGISKFTYNFTSWGDVQWTNHAFNRKANKNTFYDSKSVTTGQGKLWEFNVLPNNRLELKKFNSTAYIEDTIDVRGYTYKDYYTNYIRDTDWANFQSVYCTGGALNTTTDLSVPIPKGTGFDGGKEGEIPTEEYEATSDWKYGKQTLTWNKVDDGIDYSFYYWGNNSAQTIYGVTEDTSLDWDSAESKDGKGTSAATYEYKRVYYPCKGNTTENVKVSNIAYTYYEPKVDPKELRLNQLENQYISSQAEEVVCHGEGAPILESASDNTKIRVKDILINLYDKSNPNTLIGGTVRIMISKKKFVNGDFASPSDKVYDTTITVPASGIAKVSMETSEAFTMDKKGDKAWINVYDTAGTRLVKLVSLDPVLVSE